MVNPNHINNYHAWRQLSQLLSFEKDKLSNIISQKKSVGAEYRKNYKQYCYDLSLKYRKLQTEEQKQRDKLMSLIPDKE